MTLNNIPRYFRLFEELGGLYESRFMRPTWQAYPRRDTEDWEAVGLFLAGYAFERQGAKPDYHHIATDVVREISRQRHRLTDTNANKLVWDLFCQYSEGNNLNHANNPLCPKSTSYVRNKRLTATYGQSAIELLQGFSATGLTSNIVTFAREGLELDELKYTHNAIQQINGIGSKIASFFIRDVSLTYDLTPTKDRHLLQPVDVWVRRVFETLTNQNIRDGQNVEPVQQWILEIAIREGVCAEAINAGMWYFCSQIADSNYRLLKALGDFEYAKVLLAQYLAAVHQEIIAAERVSNLRHPD